MTKIYNAFSQFVAFGKVTHDANHKNRQTAISFIITHTQLDEAVTIPVYGRFFSAWNVKKFQMHVIIDMRPSPILSDSNDSYYSIYEFIR